MGQILFVVWRESVEALLVVGILHAWLKIQKETGNTAMRIGLWYLWLGVALGLCIAVMLAIVLLGLTEILSDVAQEYFQIAMILVACGLIVQMVFWMRTQGRFLKQEMEARLKESVQRTHWWGIAILAALAVAREGSETVVFLYGLGFGQQGHTWMQMIAALSGLALAALTFYVLQLGGRVFSWRIFFRATEIMLLFLAAGLLQTGIDKLIDIGWVSPGVDPIWNSGGILDDSSTLGSLIATFTGYRAHPSLTNVFVYLGYWLTVMALMQWIRQPKRFKI